MDQEGNIIYYGKWTQKVDYRDPRQLHDSSFKIDVETRKEFQDLQLEYDSNMPIHEKVKLFAVQGMISLINLSTDHNKDYINLHVPINLTSQQKEKLSELYVLFSTFNHVEIHIYFSQNVENRKKLQNIDEYFDMFSIKKGQEEKTEVKTI